MVNLNNTEFYTTPDGEIMIRLCDKPVRLFKEEDRGIVQELYMMIRDRYPEAFSELSKLYSTSERNQFHFEFKIVHRFLRCNCGEYDQYNFDIDKDGCFRFEEVRCPLRGECTCEEVICKPQLNTVLTSRELEILRLISDGMQANNIAGELSIAVATVNRHRENIKAKINVRTITQMVNYYITNLKK